MLGVRVCDVEGFKGRSAASRSALWAPEPPRHRVTQMASGKLPSLYC